MSRVKKTTTENKENQQNHQKLTEYFLALASCPPSIKPGRRIESEEGSAAPELLTISQVLQQQYWRGGGRGTFKTH